MKPLVLLAALSAGQAWAQGKVERVTVHGSALEGNLTKDSAERPATVYLPPSYSKEPNRRYPVVYYLHGYTGDDARSSQRFLPAGVDRAMASGASKEMILVAPNAYTAFQGSMFSSSVTTGDWESFIARDLVAYMDSHYRTLPDRASRALAGHSMGGYGTVRIGMKNPDVFSALYLLSPCCMSANMNPNPQSMARAAEVKTLADATKADFGTGAALASAAAWSPNPNRPPLFIDLPVENGEIRRDIVAKWAANAPLAMVEQFLPALKRMSGIGLDAGNKDEPIASTVRTLSGILNANRINHSFEIYDGDHNNRIPERMELRVLPFFSGLLKFER